MQDDQYFIDQELGKATLACLDSEWEGAELIIDLKGDSVLVQLRRLGRPDVGVPSDEVHAAIGKLVQHHEDTASELERATYTFHRKPDGRWKFVADFVYPP